MMFLKILQISQKTLVLESLFNKVAGLKAYCSIKKRLQHRCFLVNIVKCLRTPSLNKICERLLLTWFSHFLVTELFYRMFLWSSSIRLWLVNIKSFLSFFFCGGNVRCFIFTWVSIISDMTFPRIHE